MSLYESCLPVSRTANQEQFFYFSLSYDNPKCRKVKVKKYSCPFSEVIKHYAMKALHKRQ
jgi:hypothetical protein